MKTEQDLQLLDIPSMTTEHANWLWEHVRRQTMCFDDFSRDRGDMFAARLVTPSTLAMQYKESGLVMIENIVPRLSAAIHFFMWDPDLHERDVVAIGRSAIKLAFETYDLHRIMATPPDFNAFAQRIATRIGFKWEGRAREAFLVKGAYHDVLIYGLLRNEFREV